jgi:hypothetical protein
MQWDDWHDEIYDLLEEGPLGFDEINSRTGRSRQTTSAKLKDMQLAGLIERDFLARKYKITTSGPQSHHMFQIAKSLEQGFVLPQFHLAEIIVEEEERQRIADAFSEDKLTEQEQFRMFGYLAVLQVHYLESWRKKILGADFTEKERADIQLYETTLREYIDMNYQEVGLKLFENIRRLDSGGNLDDSNEAYPNMAVPFVYPRETGKITPYAGRMVLQFLPDADGKLPFLDSGSKEARRMSHILNDKRKRQLFLKSLRIPKIVLVLPIAGFGTKSESMRAFEKFLHERKVVANRKDSERYLQ